MRSVPPPPAVADASVAPPDDDTGSEPPPPAAIPDAAMATADGGPTEEPDAGANAGADAGPSGAGCTTTVTLTGPELVEDTEIHGGSCHSAAEQRASYSELPSFASSSDVRRGDCRVHGLLRVDTSSIPVEAEVTRAVLRLYLERECSTATRTDVDCGTFDGRWSVPYANLERAWVGPQADWYDGADGAPWSEGGATGERGTEIGHPMLTSEGSERFVEIDVTSHVRAMVARPEDNHGWLFRSHLTSGVREARFSSTEATDASRRPALVIDYARACVE